MNQVGMKYRFYVIAVYFDQLNEVNVMFWFISSQQMLNIKKIQVKLFSYCSFNDSGH